MSITSTQLSHYLFQASSTAKRIVAKHPIPCAIAAICGVGVAAVTIHRMMSPSASVSPMADLDRPTRVELDFNLNDSAQLASLFFTPFTNDRQKKMIVNHINEIPVADRKNISLAQPLLHPNLSIADKTGLISWITKIPNEQLQYITTVAALLNPSMHITNIKKTFSELVAKN